MVYGENSKDNLRSTGQQNQSTTGKGEICLLDAKVDFSLRRPYSGIIMKE